MATKYSIIQQKILEGIRKEKWKSGTAIPSDRMLSEEYGVSMGTIKLAVMSLVREGYLERIQGKGTFVVDEKQRYYGRHFTLIREDFKTATKHYYFKFIDIIQMNSDKRISELLGIGKNNKIIRLRRLIIVNKNKIGIMTSYFPSKKLGGMLKVSPTDFEQHSIPAILERFGLKRAANHELLSFIKPEKEICELLEIPEDIFVQRHQFILFDENDTPYEYRITLWHLDGVQLYREFRYTL